MTFIKLSEKSYGIIPVARVGSDFLYLLVQQTQGHWTFPKGHAKWGEIPIKTAKRELKEETGITEAYIDQNNIFETNYTHKEGWITRKKTVKFFVAFVEKQSILMQEEEILDYCWVSYEKACELLKYADMKEMMVGVKKHLISTNALRG